MNKFLLLIVVALLSFSKASADVQEDILFYPTIKYLKGAHGALAYTIKGPAPETEKIWKRTRAIDASLLDYARPVSTDQYNYVTISAIKTDKTYESTEAWLVYDEVDLSNVIGGAFLDFYYSVRAMDKTGGKSRLQLFVSTSYTGTVTDAANNWENVTLEEFKGINNDTGQEYYRETVNLEKYRGTSVRLAFKYTCDIAGTPETTGTPLMVKIGDFRVTQTIDNSVFKPILSENFEDNGFVSLADGESGASYINGYVFGKAGSEFEKIAFNEDTSDEAAYNSNNYYTFRSSATADFKGKPGVDNSYIRLTKGSTLDREAWLISSEVDLSVATGAYMEFKNASRFGVRTGFVRELYVLEGYTAYDGSGSPVEGLTNEQMHNITLRATWSTDLSTGDYFNPNWVESGMINLSDFVGKRVRIAFKVSYNLAAGSPIPSNNLFIDDLKVMAAKSTSTGIDTPKQTTKWNIYPNPVVSQFAVSGAQAVDRIEVYSILGNKVADWKITNQVAIDASSLNPGVYLLKIYGERGAVSFQKIVKK
ncbi:MAG: T9SS type A sorting domain-containing protein [Prolixibacteraceae bacterium]|jgi:hypothetical protein|nr:T9SS type A sorting domain-containing protein [Prolixibacteraceae bacterium]